MAEETENTAAPAKKGGSKLKLIIILVAAILLVAIILFVVFKIVLAPAEPGEEAAAPAQTGAPAAPQAAPAAPAAPAPQAAAPMDMGMDMGASSTEVGTIFPLPPFIVNLADPMGITYLKINLSVEFDPKNKKIQGEIEQKLPKIQDLIITILSSKALEEISTAQGKVNLRNELLRRINALMTQGRLYNVYITEFVIQKS